MRILNLRLKSALERRTSKLKNKISPKNGDCFPSSRMDTGVGQDELQEGDLVQVLPYEEIRKTLDTNGECERMAFMDGMKRYTGRTFRVYKKIKTMFDEQSWKMVRLKRAVLLEDVICDAHGLYDKEGCDRCCFYFWKEQWLRKVDD